MGIATNSLHLDSSSFHVHGEYKPTPVELSVVVEEHEQVSASKPIHITQNYSRDHRRDLKQFMLDLICSGDGDVPLDLRVADGNEADNAVVAHINLPNQDFAFSNTPYSSLPVYLSIG